MSWEEELINLYEKNSDQAGVVQYHIFTRNGKEEKIPYVLLPPFHTTVTAQIQVTVSTKGDFLGASKVYPDDKLTVIPVTEKSGSRTVGIAPHPLCDNLKYLAGDYEKYARDTKGNAARCHGLYMEGLERWQSSAYTHRKVTGIYLYLKKGTLLRDLIHEKVLVLDDTGHLSETVKIGNASQSMSFVRFIVRDDDFTGEWQEVDACWKDRSLQDRFIQFYESLGGPKEIDYLTGTVQMVSYLQPKKIRNEGDGAKLISANDMENYTFRGRFATREQAVAIGNESSQKMHNALKWIIRKQGRSYDTLTMVTWETDMQHMPPWDADTEAIASDTEEEEFADDFSDALPEGWDRVPEEKNTDTNYSTAQQFYNMLEGYGKKADHTSRMLLMAFDAATPGRLAMEEFKILETARYLENIKNWHTRCGWLQSKMKKGQKKTFYGIPGVRDIAEILYGTESKGRLAIVDKNGKRLYAELARRLIPCIWDGAGLPYDLVMTAVNRASMPQAYKERYNWERVLTLACSFVKKSRNEKNSEEEWNVALDTNCKKRDYLYGRLLAVADRIEYRTYDMEKDSGRVTNAKRYMNAFSQRPFDTWKIIEENIQPYLMKLPAIERRYYENLLDSIYQLFEEDTFQGNDRLEGLYLLGFHSQSYDLKQYKKEKDNGGEANE